MKNRTIILFAILTSLMIASCSNKNLDFNVELDGNSYSGKMMGTPDPTNEVFVLQSDCQAPIRCNIIGNNDLKNFEVQINGQNEYAAGLSSNEFNISLGQAGLNTIKICYYGDCRKYFVMCSEKEEIVEEVIELPVTPEPEAAPAPKRTIKFRISSASRLVANSPIEFQIYDNDVLLPRDMNWKIDNNIVKKVEGKLMQHTFTSTGLHKISLCQGSQCFEESIMVRGDEKPVAATTTTKPKQKPRATMPTLDDCSSTFVQEDGASCEKGKWISKVEFTITPKSDISIKDFKFIVESSDFGYLSIYEDNKLLLNRERRFFQSGLKGNIVRMNAVQIPNFYLKNGKKYRLIMESSNTKFKDWSKCEKGNLIINNNLFELSSNSSSIYDLNICK